MSGPRFQHLDDVPWEEVRKIDFGDRTASVRVSGSTSRPASSRCSRNGTRE